MRVRVACFGFVGVTSGVSATAAREWPIDRSEDASGREDRASRRPRSRRALAMSCSLAPAKADAAATRNTFARSGIGTKPTGAVLRKRPSETRGSTRHRADDRPRAPRRSVRARVRECGRNGTAENAR